MDVNFLVSLSSISLYPRLNCKYDTMKRHFACPHNPQFYICENATCVWIQLDKSSSFLSVFGRGMRLPTFLTKASDSKKLYDLIIFGLTFSYEDEGRRRGKELFLQNMTKRILDHKGPWWENLDEGTLRTLTRRPWREVLAEKMFCMLQLPLKASIR